MSALNGHINPNFGFRLGTAEHGTIRAQHAVNGFRAGIYGHFSIGGHRVSESSTLQSASVRPKQLAVGPVSGPVEPHSGEFPPG